MRHTVRQPVVLIGLVVVAFVAIHARIATRAKADPLPPPHLGYGANVRLNVDMLDGLGFDWVKLYEADYLFPTPNDFPPEALQYNILYRVKAEGWPASIQNYTEHVKQLVSMGRARGVKAYEIGNEPNIKPMWGEQNVNPEKYADLLCTVYPEIKAIDPDAVVVSAGLAPVGRQPELFWHVVMDDHVFVQRMFDRMRTNWPDRWPCFDAFGYHPQGYPYPPETSVDQLPPDDNGNHFHFREMEFYHDWMVGYGIGDRQIWATEFGYLRDPVTNPWDAADPPWDNYGWCNDPRYAPEFADNFSWMKVTEEQQADYLVRAYQYADANMPWLGVLFLYNIDWNNQGWACDHVKFFSIYKVNTGKADSDPASHVEAQAFAALAAMPKRSAYNTAPELSVQPASLTYLADLVSPGVQTRTLQIDNANASVPMTWTVATTGTLQPTVTPISGVNAALLTVQIDSAAFPITGTYTGTLTISAEPTTTIGSPITIGVSLIVVDQLNHVHLPLVARSYTAPFPPPALVTTTFGLAFVSSAEDPAVEIRYQHALTLNAALNRWPMYWPNIEKDPIGQPRVFDWSQQDANVIADIDHGLTVVPILMLTPIGLDTAGNAALPMPQVGDGIRLRQQGITIQSIDAVSSVASPPQGLYDPVFGDGTDTPGAGKSINPANRWAVFVNEAVNRYKPGGALAQAQGWSADKGIRYWEIWNEEDLNYFFIGTPADYARLLKVAYLSAKHADPQATIILGGMAHFEKPNWLNDVLNAISTYADKDASHWFMDAVASHNYSWAWQTFGYLYQDRVRLDTRGLTDVRLWLTETGVPVCDDPPYVFCPATFRATMSEQADYLIQSLAYAMHLNTEGFIWFQLYDDGANDCQYDAFGLVRNPPSGPCTARDGTPRPAYYTYQTVIQRFDGLLPYWRDRRPNWTDGNQELIALKNTTTGERTVVMWTRYAQADTATLTATSTQATLVFPDGTSQVIFPTGGVYTITLPAATNFNTPTGDDTAAIGGSPRILIEHDPAIPGTP